MIDNGPSGRLNNTNSRTLSIRSNELPKVTIPDDTRLQDKHTSDVDKVLEDIDKVLER